MARFNISATITPPESARLPLDDLPLAVWLIGRPSSLREARTALARRIQRARAASYDVTESELHPLAFEIQTENGSRVRFAVEVWSEGEEPIAD